MEKIKVASLFCGCGGMDLGVIGGFSYLGKEYKENPFEIVYAVDNDEYCTKYTMIISPINAKLRMCVI